MQLHPRAVVPSRRAIIRSECARDRAPIHENMLIPMPPPPPPAMIHCTAAGFWPFFWRLIWGCRCFCGFSSLGRPRLFIFWVLYLLRERRRTDLQPWTAPRAPPRSSRTPWRRRRRRRARARQDRHLQKTKNTKNTNFVCDIGENTWGRDTWGKHRCVRNGEWCGRETHARRLRVHCRRGSAPPPPPRRRARRA